MATTSRTALYISLYVGLWTAQTLLIKLSKRGTDTYPYDVMSVVTVTEAIKLVIAVMIYLFSQDDKPTSEDPPSLRRLIAYWPDGIWVAVPAAIYCVYNGLMFVNLAHFDPATYRTLINVRVLFSGVLFQLFFAKRLSMKKWSALVLLMVGCTVAQTDKFNIGGATAVACMALQALCSSSGGVYFAWLLQRRSLTVPIWVKNTYLYFWGVCFNLIYILFFRSHLLFQRQFFHNFDAYLLPVLLVGSLAGFATSFLLANVDVILKEYSNAIEMVTTALGALYLFGTPVPQRLVYSMGIVGVSIWLYNHQSSQAIDNHRDDDADINDKKPILPVSTRA